MIRKAQEVFQKLKVLKNKSAQAAVEFVMVLPLLIMILLGTYDIFNISVSYLQMTYLGNTFLSSNLTNQRLTSRTAGNSGNFANPTNPGMAAFNTTHQHYRSEDGFPLFFFFGPATSNRSKSEFCADYDPSSGNKNAVGTIHCIIVRHKVDLITGKMMFNKPQIELQKKVCGIQEKTFTDNNRPTWKTSCVGW